MVFRCLTLAQFEVEAFTLESEGHGTLRVEGGSFSAIGNTDMFVDGNRGGDVYVTNGGHVTIEHPNAKLRLGALNAFGNVSILGAGSQLTVAGELQFGAKGGTVLVSGGGHLSTGSATMEQGSTFLPNAVSISDGSVWTNAGDLTVRDKVNVVNGSVLVGGQMNIQSTGQLFGVGEIQGDVLNLGETWPDAVGSGDEALHIDGDYSQVDGANAGILHIQMPLSSLFGRLEVSGDVTLGGTLRIVTDAPQYGDEFDVLDWGGTLTGMFTSVDDDLPPKFEWDLSDFATSGVVRVGSRFSADFNVDGFVDQLDLSILKFGFGAASNATQLNGDADGDQDVDGADFLVWQQQFGMSAGAAVGGQIPEPSALCVALMSAAVAVCRHFKFRYEL
jgi:T5SS/PEP-CTERM-associated repeat protein